MHLKRPRGRPRKYPILLPEQVQPMEDTQVEEELPAEVPVRLGFRSCMTSKGPSKGGNRFIRPGVVLPLPRHEAENLVTLGYATYA